MSSSDTWRADLARAIAEADLRVLLMVLVHLTGDRRWLAPPFTPRRDVRLIPDPGAGLSDAAQDEIRAAALALLADGVPRPMISDPGDEMLREMMSVGLGEPVAPEYSPMIREEMGLLDRSVRWSAPVPAERLDARHVLIVGGGVSGIALGAALGRLGFPYTIVEAKDDLGGAWHVNRYPGCGVDTPNHSYSFSFGKRPRWSRYFSQRAEIHDYLRSVAREHDVERHIRYGTRLVGARWDEAARRWTATVETAEGRREIEASVLVSAIGQLDDPHLARFPGDETFRGRIFHSSAWPEDLDVSGRRVAVIGTGATAMQLVPSIADRVAKLDVYQRTAQWARPIAGYSGLIGEGTQWLLDHVPFYAEWFRFNMFWRYGDGLLPLLRRDPAWPHADRAVNKTNDRHRQEMADFIRAELGDRTDLVVKCVPDFPPYGKRILLDNGWYRTLLKPNVELVTDGIARFTADGIVTADGVERPVDVAVVCSGFRITEMAGRLGIVGRGGRRLSDAWAEENPSAHLGITVPGFPNFFCMLGPNTGPAHGGSAIFQAECQTRYITACLAGMVENGWSAIEVTEAAHDAWVAKVDAAHAELIWTHPKVNTYYRNPRGRVVSAMPWRFVDYWSMTHDPDWSEYEAIA